MDEVVQTEHIPATGNIMYLCNDEYTHVRLDGRWYENYLPRSVGRDKWDWDEIPEGAVQYRVRHEIHSLSEEVLTSIVTAKLAGRIKPMGD